MAWSMMMLLSDIWRDYDDDDVDSTFNDGKITINWWWQQHQRRVEDGDDDNEIKEKTDDM